MKTWESNCYLKYKKQTTVKVTGGRLEASSLNASRYRKSRMGPAEVIEAFNHWIQSPDIKYRERRHGDVSDWNLKQLKISHFRH
jgi:Ni/Co efflux regulator RcnB